MRRFTNWLSAPARTEDLLEHAVAAIVRQLAADQALDLPAGRGPRAIGYLHARLRRPVHDHLDKLERAEPGVVAGRRQMLFAEIRQRLVAHVLQEPAMHAAAPGKTHGSAAGSAASPSRPRKAA